MLEVPWLVGFVASVALMMFIWTPEDSDNVRLLASIIVNKAKELIP